MEYLTQQTSGQPQRLAVRLLARNRGCRAAEMKLESMLLVHADESDEDVVAHGDDAVGHVVEEGHQRGGMREHQAVSIVDV